MTQINEEFKKTIIKKIVEEIGKTLDVREAKFEIGFDMKIHRATLVLEILPDNIALAASPIEIKDVPKRRRRAPNKPETFGKNAAPKKRKMTLRRPWNFNDPEELRMARIYISQWKHQGHLSEDETKIIEAFGLKHASSFTQQEKDAIEGIFNRIRKMVFGIGVNGEFFYGSTPPGADPISSKQ